MKKAIIILMIFTFISCEKKRSHSEEYSAYEFEKYIASLIVNKDTLEFTSNFLFNLDENTINNLKEMSVIYELTTTDIIESIRNRGAVYQRIFSDSDNSLCNYLPKDGSFYDVSITYKKYKDTVIAQIEYPSFNANSMNSMELVAIYLNNKWNLITINFLNI